MEPNIKEMDAFDIALAEASGQRTQAWRDIRAGKFTSSQMYRLMSDPRSKAAKEAGEFSEDGETYINQKVAEELTGQIHDTGTANSLEWGTDMEPMAKEHFTKVTGKEVSYAGFKLFTEYCGGSPDGYVNGEPAIIEIKCAFNSGNHVEYLKLKKGIELQTEYPKIWWQVQANMKFTDMAMCYFIAFDPRFPEKQKMKIVEVHAHKEDQDRMLVRLLRAIEVKIKLIESLT